VVVEAGVGAQGEQAAGPGGADAANGLGDEAARTPRGEGGTAAQARVEHVAQPRRHGQQRVIAAHLGVGELRSALLLQPVSAVSVEYE
jgi:hypothetical protein